jgi:DNA-directed RNA polymerase beta' subunit
MLTPDEAKELSKSSAARLAKLIELNAPDNIIANEYALLSQRIVEFIDEKKLERAKWNMKTLASRCDYPGDAAGEG